MKKTCTLEAETLVSGYTKRKVEKVEVTFSFNVKTICCDNSELEANNFKTNKCRNSVFLN